MLQLSDLYKAYGPRQVLNGVSFTVEEGEILGLIGENGAGKTTTMRLVTGLIRPDGGNVSLVNQSIADKPELVRTYIGYVPDQPFLYPRLTGMELLLFVSDIRGIPRRSALERIERLLEMFDLTSAVNSKTEVYSLGMKRKLSFCLALLHEPQLLVLDEPLNGLDPKAVKATKGLLSDFTRRGGAVLLSTHLLDIAQVVCHAAVVLKDGITVGPKTATGDLEGTLEERFFSLTARKEG